MCGIVGILGNTDVSQRLFDGLKRLEYRGYDSAGIATLHDGEIDRRRAEGKLANLGAEEAMKLDSHLANGLNVSGGKIRHEAVAEALDLPYEPV